MDRRKYLRSYAGMSSLLVRDTYQKRNEEELEAYKKSIQAQRKQSTNDQLNKGNLREEQKSDTSKKLNNSGVMGNLPWEPDYQLPEGINRIGSTSDNRKKLNSFSEFLEDSRNKMFDSVTNKYIEKPFFVEMAEMRNDPKAEKYMQLTDINNAKLIAKNKEGMLLNRYVNDLEQDRNFWKDWWVVDAYNAYRIALDQALADDYSGRIYRTEELEDRANYVRDYSLKQAKAIDINEFIDLEETYGQYKLASKQMPNDLLKKLNESLSKLRGYYGNKFDPLNNPKHYQQLVDDLDHFNKVDIKDADQFVKDMKTLVGLAGDNGDPATVSVKALFTAFGLGKLARDEVEMDAYDNLVNLDLNNPHKRIQQIDKYLAATKKTKEQLAERRDKEIEERDSHNKVSDYFMARVARGSQRMRDGESQWNMDNLFYTQIQQQGFSNSSWLAQYGSMALTSVGSILNESAIGSVLGVPMVTLGAGLQYEAGRAENNAEVIENAKQRVANSLKGMYKSKMNYYDSVMKEAKSDHRMQDKTEDEILEAIVKGEWVPCQSKTYESIFDSVQQALIDARRGANALYAKDMAAVASDSATDALLWGSAAPGKMLKGVGQAFKLAKGSKYFTKRLAAIEKRLNDSAKYRFLKTKAGDVKTAISENSIYNKAKNTIKYVSARGGSIGDYTKYLGTAGTLVAPVGKAIVSAADRFLESAPGKKILHSKFAVDTAFLADDVIDFVSNIPKALLRKASKVSNKISDISGLTTFESNQMLKRGTNTIGNIFVNGLSESIEEGKQYLNAQEWIENEDPDQVVSTFDIAFSDLSKQVSLIPAALGVPFGMRWGLAKNSEVFENMAGGFLGGFFHGAGMATLSKVLGEAANSLGILTNQRSIDHMIATNAYLDNKSTIGRLELAKRLSEQMRHAPTGNILKSLIEFENFNNLQRESGEYAIDQEIIDEQRKFILAVNNVAKSEDTKRQAEQAGIKKGTEEYDKFVAAKTLYRENQQDALQSYTDSINYINNLLNQVHAESFDAEDVYNSTIVGEDEFTENPLLTLLDNTSAEELLEKTMTRRERKAAKRAKNKAERDEKRKRRLAEKGQSDEIADDILNQSVGTERDTTESGILEKNNKVREAAKLVTELLGLTDYLNSLTNISDHSDTNNKNDVDFIKQRIQDRLDRLKKSLPSDKIQHILDNRELYLNYIRNGEELMDAYRTRLATTIDLDTADMMLRMLQGKKSSIKDDNGNEKNIWGINNAKDVLSKIQETIDDKYDLMDRINREFQHRNYEAGRITQLGIEQVAADEELEAMLNSDEDIQIVEEDGTPLTDETTPIISEEQESTPETQPVEPTLPVESNPILIINDAPSVEDIDNMIQSQEDAAVRAAIDQEKENLNNAYRTRLGEQYNATVVDSEELMVSTEWEKGDKIVVFNPTTKDYLVYTATSNKDIIDEDGIYIVKNGELIPEDQRKRSEVQLGKDLTDVQRSALEALEKKIKEDNDKVVGVTGHDYFIKDEDGNVHMYPRVHTVKGDKYEPEPEMDKDYPESDYNKNLSKIRQLIQNNNIDDLKELIKDVKNGHLYLDQIENNVEYVADALATLVSKPQAGLAVNIGLIFDELTRIFFDRHISDPFDYYTLKVNVGFDDKVYNISDFIHESLFEEFKQDLIKLQQKYDELGYVLSTTRHTWNGRILVNGKYTNIAGETDIIAIDRDGKYHIIDTKTTKHSFKDGSRYFDGTNALFGRSARMSTRDDYSLLLSYYMAIIKSAMPEVQFAENPIELLPVIVLYDVSKFETSIEKVKNGEHIQGENITDYAIHNVSIGRNGEPQRISLTPVLEIVNGIFDNKDDVSEKHKAVEDFEDKLILKILNISNEYAVKAEALKRHHESLSNVLDEVKNKIYELQNRIRNPHLRLKETLDGAELDSINSILNSIEEDLLDVQNTMDTIYSQNITKQFNTTPTVPTQSTNPIIPEEDAPTDSYELTTGNNDGWFNYNTADRNNVNGIVSDDDAKIKLNSVTGNEDFATNSITEVINVTNERGQYIVYCNINYNGHTFKGVRIQIANNQRGKALLSLLNLALSFKKEGQKIVLTGMDRTAGLVDTILETSIANSKGIMLDMSIYDISTEHTQHVFGLAKMNKSGIVEVHAQGATKGTTTIIYRFKKGEGVSGVYYTIIKPNHHNATVPTKPLYMPMWGSRLNKDDILFLMDIFDTIKNYGNPNNVYEYINPSDGQSLNLPLSYKDIVSLFIPYGRVLEYNKSIHVEVKGNQVVFTEYATDKTTVLETSYDLNDPKRRQDLINYLTTQTKININKDILNCRLGSNENKMFERLNNLFNRHPEIDKIQLGKSKIVFNREDFTRPDGLKDGLSGLGWMAKNGMVVTNYGGILNPRFSYTSVDTIQDKPITPPDEFETAEPTIDPEDFGQSGEDDFDIDQIGGWEHVLHNQNPDKKAENAKKHLHRLFGSRVPVEVAARLSDIFKDVKFSAGAVGAVVKGAIGLQYNAERGTEYHEGFHLTSRFLLSNKLRNKMYKVIERIIERDNTLGTLNNLIELAKIEIEKRKLDINPKEFALEEYGAELCRSYFNRVEDIDFSLRKIFDYIALNIQAFREIGDWRLATLFVAMRMRVFRLPGLRLSKSKSQIAESWTSKATYDRNGISYYHIMNDLMYDKIIQSMVYYICRLQNVRPDGSNLANLSLDKESLEKRIVIKDKKGKPKIDPKTGKPKLVSIKEVLIISSKTRDKQGNIIDTPTTLAIRELFDNYDETYKSIKRYMDEIGIDYHEKEESEREDQMVTGDDELAGGGNTDHNYDKASYEKSKVTKATTGIKFYTSMIKAFGTIVEKTNKEGEVYKEVLYKKNEFGLYEFMDSKEVLATILSKLHKVKSKDKMISTIKKLAQHDPLFFLLDEMLSAKESKLKDKNGNVDFANELVLTQFFNLVASSKNNFTRIQAKRDSKTGMYTLSVEPCGQGYESRQYRSDWGKMLTYGGTELFDRDNNGNIVVKQIGRYSGVEYLGAMFDRIEEMRNEFSEYQIMNLNDHGKPNLMLVNPKTGKREPCNVTTEDGCNLVIDTLCSMFNKMGIQFDSPEFRYMLSEKYRSEGFTTIQSQLQQFFNQTGEESIEGLYGGKYKIIRKDKNTNKWCLNILDGHIYNGTRKILPENIFTNNAFASELSDWKYRYQHSTTDLSVLIGNGKSYYEISENSTITDVTDGLSTGEEVVDKLSKFCYNYMKVSGTDVNGKEVTRELGSILLKEAIKAKSKGIELPLLINTFTQFKTDAYDDEGSDYYEMSEREDYIAKCTILESGGLIFPTMSDKKTWVYITGLTLPGIDYKNGVNINEAELRVLEQLVDYADLERASVAQTIEQLKTLPDNQKVTNFHKGATITDKNGNKHTVANGTIFGCLTGIRTENNKFISFTDQLDSNGNYISPEKNLEKADREFFSKTHELKMAILKRTLDNRVDEELKHLLQLGIINEENGVYNNVGINDDSLKAIAKHKFNIEKGDPNKFQKNACIRDYVLDIVSKSIISIHEVERCYSGHPGFFKYKFDKKGRLANRHEDEFKRFGGLISTGINNNTDIEGAPEDGMYTCAVVDNEMIQSPELEYIVEKIATSEWKSALRQVLYEEAEYKNQRREVWRMVSEMSLDEVKDYLEKNNKKVYDIINAKVKKETDSYRKDKENKGIDVADGGAYISPEMTKWLLQMCGEYDSKVDLAFKILMNPDKYDVVSQEDAYSLVATKVIGAQKYTAYGQRLSADNKLMIPYYNKMALFPVFKCMATGKFAKIYKQMQENKDSEGKSNPIHMLMVQSAVKLGDEGSVAYDTSSEFPGFHTYKQEFKYLRKQFNTNPHHKEDQSMGTQMIKVALTSLIKDKEYYKDKNGKAIYGEDILRFIMNDINKLTNIGREEFRNLIRDDNGEIDPKKFSEFLIDQMSSRDADKSMIESLLAVEIKDGENTIGWKLKHPLAAISRMNWLLSVLKSLLDKRMVEVHTYGNAFYQRSIWGMEGHSVDYIDDEDLAKDLNGGEELLMIVKDGPAKGAMECLLTMDYFADILKEAGLDKATFSEQRQALIDAGIIGPNAKANLIGYRIPTQAQSSIHALVCRDVIPVINHNIILPKEFTKITGSDFDIDKIFIASTNYTMKKEDGKWTASDQYEEDSKKYVQNSLLSNYLRLLCDEEGMHIANRSIDNDTDLVLDVLHDIESNKYVESYYKPVDAYDFYTLSKHTSTKLNFLTGKSGIGPFALNNNSQILTTLYDVEFSETSFMNKLGRVSLHDQNDMDGQSIMSWISALINAHVDIAKDPYISRLNVNEMTYNLVNLLIRTGYGKRTFYFTKQPAMIKMAEKVRQAKGSFMQELNKSKREIKKEAKQEGIIECVGQEAFDNVTKRLNVSEKKPYGDIKLYAKELLEGDILRDIARGDTFLETVTLYTTSLRPVEFTAKEIQVLVYYLDMALETPALKLSDLVKYSKIDTKKQGKNVSEQLAYLRGVSETFNDPSLMVDIFGESKLGKIYVDFTLMKLASNTEFEAYGLDRLYNDSFIKHKTKYAIQEFMNTMSGQVFEATPGFLNLLNSLCNYFNRYDSNSIYEITQALSSKIKADAINDYAEKMNIDIHGLVSGNNTIYDRLNHIKVRLKTDPEYSDVANNALLNLLIGDKSWEYNYNIHEGHVMDRFLNLKFIRLFDSLDKSNAKTDYIISAWEQLLENGAHPEIRKFARDLCVYAFVTSGDKGGRTKLFNYVPNSFRESSGYVSSIEKALNNMKNAEYGSQMFSDRLIDDIVLNNQDSSTFVKSIDITNKNWKKGKPKWSSVYMNQLVPIGKDANGNDVKYKPKYPIFITTDMSTPIDVSELPPFIKISHMSRKHTDNSSRAESIYKLIAFVPGDEGVGTPVYVKVNTKGYHIQGGYDYYEYGKDVYDAEYVPNIYTIKSMVSQIVENRDKWDNVYGSGFTHIAQLIGMSVEQSNGYRLTLNWELIQYLKQLEEDRLTLNWKLIQYLEELEEDRQFHNMNDTSLDAKYEENLFSLEELEEAKKIKEECEKGGK